MTHIISYSAINAFSKTYPEAKTPLNAWYQLVHKNKFSNINELKTLFSSADAVKGQQGKTLTVFNIGGNKFRLIAAIHYNSNKLYIRHILTHDEYDKGHWKS